MFTMYRHFTIVYKDSYLQQRAATYVYRYVISLDIKNLPIMPSLSSNLACYSCQNYAQCACFDMPIIHKNLRPISRLNGFSFKNKFCDKIFQVSQEFQEVHL